MTPIVRKEKTSGIGYATQSIAENLLFQEQLHVSRCSWGQAQVVYDRTTFLGTVISGKRKRKHEPKCTGGPNG